VVFLFPKAGLNKVLSKYLCKWLDKYLASVVM
jgi:hypothetical protein